MSSDGQLSGWRRVKIADVAEVVGGGTPKTTDPENFGGDIPWITPKDLASHSARRISQGERNISGKGLESSSARLLPPNTVLVSSRAPIGYCAIADVPLATNQGFRSLILRDPHSPEFFHYLIKSSTSLLESRASGSTFKEISGGTFKKTEVTIPPPAEQRRIAWVLGSLDDKIELNRQLARTLEEIAAALFQARFVDFVGVDEFEESEIGPIPRGWSALALDELAEFLNGGALTKYANGKGRPILRIKELNSGLSEATPRTDRDLPEKHIARHFELLFSWSGTLDVYRWVGLEAAINQHIFKVVPKAGTPSWFIEYGIRRHLQRFQAIAQDKATTMGHIKRHHLSDAKVATPPSDVLAAANREFQPILDRLSVALAENETLTALRDTLLPKLISGQIRVPEGFGPDDAAELASDLAGEIEREPATPQTTTAAT